MRERNRELLHELGTVIYLRATAATIYARLKNDTTRPLLQGENPEFKIKQMIEMRNPYYEQSADVVIDVDGLDFEHIIRKIKEAV